MVLDLNMPDMHGLAVVTFVRGHERYRPIPIIVLTTRGDDDSSSSHHERLPCPVPVSTRWSRSP